MKVEVIFTGKNREGDEFPPGGFEFDLPDNFFLETMELRVNGDAVTRQVFTMHDDSKRLHTICSRTTDDIREIDW